MTDRWPDDEPQRERRVDPADDQSAMTPEGTAGMTTGAGDEAGATRPTSSTAAIAEAGGTSPSPATSDRPDMRGMNRASDPGLEAGANDAQTTDATSRPDNRSVAGASASTTAGGATPLFDRSQTDDLRGRWTDIQAGFVDEPRSAVEQADALVAEVMKRLAEGFAGERSTLEEQWARGNDVSTEDLRVALTRYRSFFDRLLSL